jgi:flagellar basal body-associated protein FliL
MLLCDDAWSAATPTRSSYIVIIIIIIIIIIIVVVIIIIIIVMNTARRFELFVLGMEYCNAYTELNDPFLQVRTHAIQSDQTTLPMIN